MFFSYKRNVCCKELNLAKLTAGCLGLGRIEGDCQRAWSIFWEVIKKYSEIDWDDNCTVL